MIKTRKTIATFLALICWMLPAHGRPRVDNSVIRFRLVQGFAIIVPVMINGTGPFDFLLDTGTSATIIPPGLAHAIGLQPVDRLMLTTITGARPVPRSYLEQVMLGQQLVTNLEVIWQELPALNSLDRRVCGVLGQNFLSQFNYLINYSNQSLTFEQRDELRNKRSGERVPVDEREGTVVLAIQPGRGQQKAVRLALDSGAPELILLGSVCRSSGLQCTRNEGQDIRISTNTGSQLAPTGLVRRVLIGGASLLDVPVVFVSNQVSRGSLDSQSEDGVLPTRLFDQIYFNNRESYVVVEPR